MPSLKASVLIWKWWHRKGLCRRKSPEKQSLTHSHARQDELAALAFDLIQMLGRGFILTTDDCSAWTAELKEAWKERGTDDPDDSERLLDKVKHLSRERIELLILQVNVGRIRQEKGDGSIGIRELAKRMGIGVTTLYRIYGKNVLRKFLNQSATEKFPGSKEQTAQAVVSKRSGEFTYQNNDEKEEKFWDENRATTGGTANQVLQPPEGKRSGAPRSPPPRFVSRPPLPSGPEQDAAKHQPSATSSRRDGAAATARWVRPMMIAIER
jgi:hypothetical protein